MESEKIWKYTDQHRNNIERRGMIQRTQYKEDIDHIWKCTAEK